MEIIRFADLKSELWRNGGGATREIARQTGSGDNWDWRLSIADVTKAGDYSAFPGMERVLTVIEGELLALRVAAAEYVIEKYRPFRFDGGSPSASSLPGGSVRNLNLITRRDAFKGHTSIIELTQDQGYHVTAGRLGVLLEGTAAVGGGGDRSFELRLYDTVVGSDLYMSEILGAGFLAVVSVEPVTAASHQSDLDVLGSVQRGAT